MAFIYLIGFISIIGFGYFFISRKENDEKIDQSEDIFSKNEEFKDHKAFKEKEIKSKIGALKKPKRNKEFVSYHGYREDGFDIESILYYVWLLDLIEDEEYYLDDDEFISNIENDNDSAVFYDFDDKPVLHFEKNDGVYNITEYNIDNLSYEINPETGEISILNNNDVINMTYSNDEWDNSFEEETMTESIVDEVVEDFIANEIIDEVVSVNEIELGTEENEIIIEESHSETESLSETVDSDTSY